MVNEQGQRIADKLFAVAVEQKEGLRVDTAADYERLMQHRLSGFTAHCWPGRAHKAFVASGVRALLRVNQRMAVGGSAGKGLSFLAAVWIGLRFVLWTLLLRAASLVLPRCWCRKGRPA